MQKPNIVYIFADDMGYGDVGCNNPESKIPTPRLDQLAVQGMRFTDAHAPSSVCTPSRYALLTGRYCWRTDLKYGVLWSYDAPLIEPERLTVAKLLRDNGYRTEAIGKWHLGWDWRKKDGSPAAAGFPFGPLDYARRAAIQDEIDYQAPLRGGPVDCGFDHYFGIDVPNFPPYCWFENDRLTELPTVQKPDDMFGHDGLMAEGWELEKMIPEFTRRAKNIIAESGEDPFFLFLALTSPHTPICPNKEFIGKSGCGLYGDFVCEVDWVVGEVMDALEARGIADNTLLIFSTDNGPESIPEADGGSYEHARLHGHYSMGELRGVKRDVWEGGHRVPFIARWPAMISAGSTCDQLVSLADLVSTCADICDTPIPDGQAEDAVSILSLLKGDDNPVRDFAIHHSCGGTFAIRKGDWVFVDGPCGGDLEVPEWFKKERGYTDHNLPGELFNLKDDLSERYNRYAEEPERVAELKALLERVKGGEGGATPSTLPTSQLSE